jgi:D-alanyl-D-alanine carboxypeptidase/D-alanyl-D-alanine-endopeptidase (penicillin-binding protein 4)
LIIKNFFNSLNTLINKKLFGLKELLILNYSLLITVLLASCSVSKQIAKQADTILLKDSAISSGFIGISIYEPATNTYWYNYNATKYFTPASNTKLFTLYAGMKYLGDSLVGLRYIENDSTITIVGTGDPTLLHPDFKKQQVVDFIKNINKKIVLLHGDPKFKPYGPGWSWDDYNDDYMVERSQMPVYGNGLKIEYRNGKLNSKPQYQSIIQFPFSDSTNGKFRLERAKNNNFIQVYPSKDIFKELFIPFANTMAMETSMLSEAFNKPVSISKFGLLPQAAKVIHSQPTDSLFTPMMHRSDNFFAEQTLLMVSNERLGYMSDEAIIDTLLKSDLGDLPQKPKWVDGSGLSRYNLFTPQAFIFILNKLKNEFGWARLQHILPTGGQGTLNSYFLKDSGFIYAKTGTLSNNCALSGFLTTNSGKLLIFSILANHYQTGATPIRQATERFLEGIREKY